MGRVLVNIKNFEKICGKFSPEIGLILPKKNFIKSRYDIENIENTEKINFILSEFNIASSDSCVFRILYWEDLHEILDCFNKDTIKFKNYKYKGKKKPGVLLIEFKNQKKVLKSFLREVLTRHFNFEIGLYPALDMRIQLCLNQNNNTKLLDIYDDRGFFLYYLNVNS